ncbi:hypothetical protein ABES80_01095 [Bacillus gobiensis]|uniref:hypothetical protein n=1 Tax=Bacillus gobiensis TaxID=1441095 RepID=UPI003D2570F0
MERTLKEEMLWLADTLETYAKNEKSSSNIDENQYWYALGIERTCTLIREHVERVEKKH